MFISAGGLPGLALIFSRFPHERRPALTPLVIDIIYSVFKFKSTTPKSCFARMLAQAEFIDLLAKRFLLIDKDDPCMSHLCLVIEIFSQADPLVKRRMACPTFIDHIFSKVRRTDEDPLLSEWDLFTILRSMNNLAMDKGVIQLLWETSLVNRLIDFLRVDRPGFKMNTASNICFSALFHLSRVLSPTAVGTISEMVPALIYVLRRESPLKGLALTSFLEFVTTHTDDTRMRDQLKNNGASDVLFGLLVTHGHKDQVMAALSAWCLYDTPLIEDVLVAHLNEFVTVLADVFQTGNQTVQTQVASKLLMICDKCPRLTTMMAHSDVVKTICVGALSNRLDEFPDLRKLYLGILALFYHMHLAPKQMIAEFRIDLVAEKLSRDPSVAVSPIAAQLLTSVASNFVL
jgi:hypothetical protein